jgi:CheY-like chemotaxis protein
MSVLARKRILIVEDEHIVAMLVEDLIIELGAEAVGPATTLETALDMAQSGDFDLAILDMNINGARSTDVALALKARGIPFVFATGYGAAEDLGQAALLEKPFQIEQMKAALESAVASTCVSASVV